MGIKRKQHNAEFKARVAMASLSGEKTLAELSAEFGVHPTMISNWKQELVKRASELFVRGSKAPVEDAQKVIDDLHRKIGQLQVERDFLAGQPAISRVLRGSRLHAFSLFFPGSCPNNRDRRSHSRSCWGCPARCRDR